MLKTTADDNPATWPQRLPTVMAAYRMTVHKTTGMTPNMAMLGREVMFPAALIARPPEEPHRTTVPFVHDLINACVMLVSRQREHRKHTMMIGRDKRSSPKASSCGYSGHGHRFA